MQHSSVAGIQSPLKVDKEIPIALYKRIVHESMGVMEKTYGYLLISGLSTGDRPESDALPGSGKKT
jgi:hypothetical protein